MTIDHLRAEGDWPKLQDLHQRIYQELHLRADVQVSGFGVEPSEIVEILRPLDARLSSLKGQQIGGRRRKFVYTLLLDAHRTGLAICALLDARAQRVPLMADSVELLARRMVEHTIVAAYVSRYGDSSVVDRFLKTSAAAWERSMDREREGEDPSAGDQLLPVKQLPKYQQMAEAVDTDLVRVWGLFSYLAHPRQALPYSLLEYNFDSDEYFWLRAAKAVGNLETVVRHLVNAYDAVDQSDAIADD